MAASGDKPGGHGKPQRYGEHGRYVAAGTSATSTDPAEGFAQIDAAHPKVRIEMSHKRHADQPTWAIDRLEVASDERGRGLASAALRDITTYADAMSITLALTPEQTGDAGGLSTAALRKWYGRYGFKPNRGKYPDITESMVREPATPKERGAVPMTETLFRSVATTLERTDRRTVEGLFMPWDVPADVIDVDQGTGRVERYREGFRRGAFDRQVSSLEPGVVRRIVLRDQHHDGLGKLGHVVALRNEDAGLHGVVSLLPSRVADVDALLDDEVTGLSCEFHPLGRADVADGVVWRTRAHLVAVALEAQPAYADARVLAMRASDEIAALDAEEAAAAQRELEELDEWLASARDSVRRYVPTLSDDR